MFYTTRVMFEVGGGTSEVPLDTLQLLLFWMEATVMYPVFCVSFFWEMKKRKIQDGYDPVKRKGFGFSYLFATLRLFVKLVFDF
jgi:hypothetical protein